MSGDMNSAYRNLDAAYRACLSERDKLRDRVEEMLNGFRDIAESTKEPSIEEMARSWLEDSE